MEEDMKANGKILICMEKVNTLGRMVDIMMANILMIKKMAGVYIDGLVILNIINILSI